MSVLSHAALFDLWVKNKTSLKLFPCCCVCSSNPWMQWSHSFFHCSFLSVLLLFSQLQHQQFPSSAQLAPFPDSSGGEHFLSASLAPRVSTVRNLASVPQLKSAGKVSHEQTALQIDSLWGTCSKEHVFVCIRQDQNKWLSVSHYFRVEMPFPRWEIRQGSERCCRLYRHPENRSYSFHNIQRLFYESLILEMAALEPSYGWKFRDVLPTLVVSFSWLQKNNLGLCVKRPLEFK